MLIWWKTRRAIAAVFSDMFTALAGPGELAPNAHFLFSKALKGRAARKTTKQNKKKKEVKSLAGDKHHSRPGGGC